MHRTFHTSSAYLSPLFWFICWLLMSSLNSFSKEREMVIVFTTFLHAWDSFYVPLFLKDNLAGHKMLRTPFHFPKLWTHCCTVFWQLRLFSDDISSQQTNSKVETTMSWINMAENWITYIDKRLEVILVKAHEGGIHLFVYFREDFWGCICVYTCVFFLCFLSALSSLCLLHGLLL